MRTLVLGRVTVVVPQGATRYRPRRQIFSHVTLTEPRNS
jgi:hypothetical protein